MDEGLIDQLEYSQKSNSHVDGRTSDPFVENKGIIGPKELIVLSASRKQRNSTISGQFKRGRWISGNGLDSTEARRLSLTIKATAK